jgi:hypothetical protein
VAQGAELKAFGTRPGGRIGQEMRSNFAGGAGDKNQHHVHSENLVTKYRLRRRVNISLMQLASLVGVRGCRLGRPSINN